MYSGGNEGDWFYMEAQRQHVIQDSLIQNLALKNGEVAAKSRLIDLLKSELDHLRTQEKLKEARIEDLTGQNAGLAGEIADLKTRTANLEETNCNNLLSLAEAEEKLTEMTIENQKLMENQKLPEKKGNHSKAKSKLTTNTTTTSVATTMKAKGSKSQKFWKRCYYEGCNRKFKNILQLKDHIDEEDHEQPLKCDRDDCEKRFGNKFLLYLHQSRHNSKEFSESQKVNNPRNRSTPPALEGPFIGQGQGHGQGHGEGQELEIGQFVGTPDPDGQILINNVGLHLVTDGDGQIDEDMSEDEEAVEENGQPINMEQFLDNGPELVAAGQEEDHQDHGHDGEIIIID